MIKGNKKYGLILKVATGIVLGIIVGIFVPKEIVDIINILSIFISKFINFTVPLIIIGFVVHGIISLEFSSGKILGVTCAISYIFMLMSGFLSYFISSRLFPKILSPSLKGLDSPTDIINNIKHFNYIDIPPIMDVNSALILSFIVGIGISHIKGETLKNIFTEFHEIIEKFVHKVMIPLIPVYVFGVFVKMSSSGKILKIFGYFSRIIMLIIVVHILVISAQYVLAGLVTKKNPIKLIKNVIPSYTTALATQSSVAVIPISMKNAMSNGVSESIANFVLPLCSTIHLSGSIASITCTSIAVMLINGCQIKFSSMVPFILMLGLVMVAAPGVPCGAVFAASGILESILGFDASMMALIVALHVVQDGFGTACNVSGDGSIAVIINHINNIENKVKIMKN